MRVALLHPTYWPEVRRGGERLVHDLAAALGEEGHDATVVTTHRGPPARSREAGFDVYRGYRPPGRLVQRRQYEEFLGIVPSTWAHLVRNEYDLVHAFYPVDAWAAIRAGGRSGPPVVFSLNGIPTRPWLVRARYRLPMIADAAQRAAACTVLSEPAARNFERYLLRTPAIVPGGVRCSDFRADTERAPTPTLVCAASLADPRKRGSLLLRAFARVRERRPEARLLLVGRRDPWLRLELPPGATWIAADRTQELALAYASAWASVLPARDEGFGLVIVESLAAGTPVVAARSGACPDVLTTPEVGTLFETDDEDDLVRALDGAIAAPPTPEVAAACREHADRWDWSRVLPRFLHVYESVRGG